MRRDQRASGSTRDFRYRVAAPARLTRAEYRRLLLRDNNVPPRRWPAAIENIARPSGRQFLASGFLGCRPAREIECGAAN
jgi:hypothetical protein